MNVFLFFFCFCFFAFYHEIFLSKNLKIFFYKKFVHLGENIFTCCSPITEVHVTFTQRVSDANGIKPGSNQKMTDTHAAEYVGTLSNLCKM